MRLSYAWVSFFILAYLDKIKDISNIRCEHIKRKLKTSPTDSATANNNSGFHLLARVFTRRIAPSRTRCVRSNNLDCTLGNHAPGKKSRRHSVVVGKYLLLLAAAVWNLSDGKTVLSNSIQVYIAHKIINDFIRSISNKHFKYENIRNFVSLPAIVQVK